MIINLNDPYLAYYRRQQLQQTGGAIDRVFHGAPYQRGHGIGSFLGGMIRTIAPLIKSGAKSVGQEALRSGVGFLTDLAGGKITDPKTAANLRLREFTGSLKRKADEQMERMMLGGGGGISAKRQRVTRKSNAKRATRKASAKRAMHGRGRKPVTPQSLAKLLRVRTSASRREGGGVKHKRLVGRRQQRQRRRGGVESRKKVTSPKKRTYRSENLKSIDIFS